MNWKCLFGHKWISCKCNRCGKTRDEQHDWDGCKCNRCGKTRDEQHDWEYVYVFDNYDFCKYKNKMYGCCDHPDLRYSPSCDICMGNTVEYRCKKCLKEIEKMPNA